MVEGLFSKSKVAVVCSAGGRGLDLADQNRYGVTILELPSGEPRDPETKHVRHIA